MGKVVSLRTLEDNKRMEALYVFNLFLIITTLEANVK